MAEWQTLTIGELIESGAILIHKDGNHGANYPRVTDFGDDGLPFFTAKSVSDWRLDIANAPRLSRAKATTFKFGFVEQEDVLLSHNATVGRVAIVPKLTGEAVIGTSLTQFRLDKSQLLPEFLAIYFSSRGFQDQLSFVMAQTTRNQVPITEQRRLPVVVPPISIQKRISKIIFSLHNKIELNRRMNETLEGMAQAIFRDWFVDFGPTRRKLAGIADPIEIMGGIVQDPARAAKLAAPFPAALGDNGLPAGWEERSLGAIASASGGSIQTGPFGSQLHQSDYADTGVPVVMPANLTYSEIVEDGIARVSQTTADQLARHKLAPGDIVYGRRGDIGRKALIGEEQAGWLCGTGCLRVSIRSKETPTNFLFYQLDLPSTLEWIRSRAIGATMPNLNTSILGEIPILVPGSTIATAFDELVAPLTSKKMLSRRENQTLAATRDLLLPKLMSGEIRLRDAAALAEAGK